MNKITILAIGATFVATILAITAFEVEAAPPSKVVCPAENVQHWTQILFQIVDVVGHDTLPDLEPENENPRVVDTFNSFEVKILQNIDVDIHTNQMVVDRLTELGYFNRTRMDQPLDISNIFNIDVEYSTICAEI